MFSVNLVCMYLGMRASVLLSAEKKKVRVNSPNATDLI